MAKTYLEIGDGAGEPLVSAKVLDPPLVVQEALVLGLLGRLH
jgi:hypothetical protein